MEDGTQCGEAGADDEEAGFGDDPVVDGSFVVCWVISKWESVIKVGGEGNGLRTGKVVVLLDEGRDGEEGVALSYANGGDTDDNC